MLEFLVDGALGENLTQSPSAPQALVGKVTNQPPDGCSTVNQ